jgi:hypothetical protein
MPAPEELARQTIDALPTQGGWVVQNYKQLNRRAKVFVTTSSEPSGFLGLRIEKGFAEISPPEE